MPKAQAMRLAMALTFITVVLPPAKRRRYRSLFVKTFEFDVIS
jgi:hypothetical protein